MKDLKEFEKIIEYKFKNKDLLKEALTHPSLSCDQKERFNYERLEILGDSILSFVIVEYLFEYFLQEEEGSISKRKSIIVSTKYLARVAREIHLGDFMFMSKGEEDTDGRNKDKNLENSMEALIGAIYLDSNIAKVKDIILKYWIPIIANFKNPPKDTKTRLQEWLQKNRKPLPIYTVNYIEREKQSQIFYMDIEAEGLPKMSEKARSKKEAEKRCALKMINYIKRHIDKNI